MLAIWELFISLLPGLGLAWAADKIAPKQVPQYQPTGIGFNIKTVIIIVAIIAGALLLGFLAKTFNIKLFKRR